MSGISGEPVCSRLGYSWCRQFIDECMVWALHLDIVFLLDLDVKKMSASFGVFRMLLGGSESWVDGYMSRFSVVCLSRIFEGENL